MRRGRGRLFLIVAVRSRRNCVVQLVALAAVGFASCTNDGGGDDPSLHAAFSAEFVHATMGPTSCPVTAVRFKDESTGGPTEWEWQFPDGATSDEQHPTWETDSVAAEVTLTVRRGDDHESATEQVDTVQC
jgi:PKD repeat protein